MGKDIAGLVARLRRLALAGVAVALAASLAAPVRAATSSAEVVSIEGKGEYRGASQAAWRPAVIKQPLFGGDFVHTLELSKMAIVFADRTQVQLAQNSTLQIKEVAAKAGERTIMNLNRGRAWTQSKTTPSGLVMETPSALAAIRGTDWEMVVDDDGRATLSVFSGEVEFYNDQGRVSVQAHEQALAEKGRAPVKLRLQVSRDRIQWVSAFTIDASRHPGEDLPHAYERLRNAPQLGAKDALLLGDIEIYRGDLAAARAVFERASKRFPDDEQFDVALARTALLSADMAEARRHAKAALVKQPASVDALVTLGEIERRDGHAQAALAAYTLAVAAGTKDPRGWHGLGVVEGERENVRRARADLTRALALDPSDAQVWGELASVEGFAGNLEDARAAVDKALALQPDNYVALTGLGVLELQAGHHEAAVQALLRASVIEPKYARAHLYLAAAYYQSGREPAALEELRRAAEMDPKDPLPHLLAGLIYIDHLDPVRAWDEANRALALMPYLKSLNQVADNQKGVANAGYPLGFMGLEAWARSAAHRSYLPFWGGSHFFLADRYPGEFDQRSELMQGFLTDPLAFGASNRFQTLVREPGHHGTLSLHYGQSDDLRLEEGIATFNGYAASPMPFAYFAEAIDTHVDPRNSDIRLRGPTETVALGAKPTHELDLFLYANHIALDADVGRPGVTGVFDRISGSASRVDAGARYAFNASSSVWLKAGGSREDDSAEEATTVIIPGVTAERDLRFATKPSMSDVALRHTFVVARDAEFTWGAEAARTDTPKHLDRDSGFHFSDRPGDLGQRLDDTDRDHSHSVYGLARVGDERLRMELGVAWTRYTIDRDIVVDVGAGPTPVGEKFGRNRASPMAGLVWRPIDAVTLRGACRRWIRPASLDTLMPVAIAAMPLDDQLVFAGGQLDQCRAQAEWTGAERTYASVFAERSRVHNMVSPLDGVLNTNSDITNLDRLRNRALSPPPKPDVLEDTPVFGEGVARRANAAFEKIIGYHLATSLQYTYTDSENTASAFAGNRIPYLARHQASLGLAWAPGWHTYVTMLGIYRTRRFTDEANTVELPSGWDAQFMVYWETPDKHWSVELHGANLLKKQASDLFGVLASYRF